MLLEFMARWEPLWLFCVLLLETYFGYQTLVWVKKEYAYDEQKDVEKKQKRTRTTKKTTTQPSGASITEESSEVVEPTGEQKL